MDTKTLAAAFNFPAAAAAAFGLHFTGRDAAAVAAQFNGGQLSPSSIPVDYTPESAEARLIEYRGEKVAAFEIETDTLICLPQAYELFLKHLVGGLHTVYTKLKRLEIVPRVCNVEQVRALRSLGAIQPGVNRCKLISCTDFDTLYKDCTSARQKRSRFSSRPGRPPKRSPVPFATPSHQSCVTNGTIPLPKKLKLAAAAAAANDFNGGAGSGTSSASDGSRSQSGMPAGLFGSQLAPNLFPFFPLTPQQFVMSQMSQLMNSNAALAKQLSDAGIVAAMNGAASVNSGNESIDVDENSDTLHHENNGFSISEENGVELGSSLLKDQDCKEGLMALNLSKAATAAKPVLANESGDVRRFLTNGNATNHALDKEELSDFSDDELDFGNDEQIENGSFDGGQTTSFQQQHSDVASLEKLAHQLPRTSASAKIASKLLHQGYSSVESLLLNVMGLLEVAITTSRLQEQQIKKEAGALSTLYDQEKSLRQKSESMLQQEQRLKGLYMKRWRKAEKARSSLKQKLTRTKTSVDKARATVQTQTDSESNNCENGV